MFKWYDGKPCTVWIKGSERVILGVAEIVERRGREDVIVIRCTDDKVVTRWTLHESDILAIGSNE